MASKHVPKTTYNQHSCDSEAKKQQQQQQYVQRLRVPSYNYVESVTQSSPKSVQPVFFITKFLHSSHFFL